MLMLVEFWKIFAGYLTFFFKSFLTSSMKNSYLPICVKPYESKIQFFTENLL